MISAIFAVYSVGNPLRLSFSTKFRRPLWRIFLISMLHHIVLRYATYNTTLALIVGLYSTCGELPNRIQCIANLKISI